jgi:hypothetical protein
VGRLDATKELEDWKWKRVQGLADGDGTRVSLESVNFPGYYLRQVGREVLIQKNDGTSAFAKSATFKEVPGLADSANVSFESVLNAGQYLRHHNFVLYVEKATSAIAKADATWKVNRDPVGIQLGARQGR